MSNSKPDYWQPAVGDSGMQELHFAAYCGDLDRVNTAIRSGAGVNARDAGNWTPLHWVVDMGMVAGAREQIVEALIAAGADTEARDLEGSTPLMIACRAGNRDVVCQLVRNGAAINVADEKGLTPLMQAACYGDPGTVSFLLESGADAAALNIDGRSAIDLALKQGWNEVADLLANWTSNQRR